MDNGTVDFQSIVNAKVKQWNEDKNIVKIDSSNNDSIILNFNDSHTFKMIYPKTTNESYIIEYINNNNMRRLGWISDLNIYFIQKKPEPKKMLDIFYKQYNKYQNTLETRKLTTIDSTIELNTAVNFELEKMNMAKYIESVIETSKSQIYTNTNTNIIFDRKTVANLIAREFIELWEQGRVGTGTKHFGLELVNNNLYHWRVKYDNFDRKELNNALEEVYKKYGYDSIMVDIHLHDTLYPNYPPTVKVIRPKLMDSLTYKISNTKMLQLDYWTSTRSMEFVVKKIYSLLATHAKVLVDFEMNDQNKYPNGAFMKIEEYLIELASNITNDISTYDEIDTENYEMYKKRIGSSVQAIEEAAKAKSFQTVAGSRNGTGIGSGKKTVWASGTGYGSGSGTGWDYDSYFKSIEERDKMIQNILNKIIVEIQDVNTKSTECMALYNTINNSLLINYLKSQFIGTTLIEINKHKDLYKVLLELLQNLATEHGIFLFGDNNNNDNDNKGKSLFSIFTELNQLCQSALKLNKHNLDELKDEMIDSIVTLYSMIEPLYKEYVSKLERQAEETKIAEAKQKNIEEEYVNTMIQLLNSDEDYNLIGTNYHYQKEFDAVKKIDRPRGVMKRLRDEALNFRTSLPISYDATIISRHDPNYMTAIRTAITGPRDTPYENGIFLFDTFINTNFPSDPPNVWFLNHGGKRTNPNLYDTGYVCLSIIGTWRGGVKGESWDAKTSTLSQIYISIQSQILVDYPYFNEPGYESSYNNAAGMQAAENYNQNSRLYTMKFAMAELIENPKLYPQFEDFITAHFRLKKDKVLQTCEKWVNMATSANKNDYQQTYARIQKALDKL